LGYFALLQHHSDKKIIVSDIGYFAILQQMSGFADRIFGYFAILHAANEWIRRPDIRIFRDFATGTGTWYWYNICDLDPYIRILVDTDFIT
jgi:hypothetical protein